MVQQRKRILTNIAPYRSMVNEVSMPDYGVYKLDQASNCCPYHIKTSAGVQCLKMPGEWYKDEEEAQESKDRKDGIRVNHWCIRCSAGKGL